MKKQFFRVKQLADQTFSRAGKTDVLSDDLQEADRKVEYIKNSCQNVGKKLSSCLVSGQLQGESGTKEKLLKKSPGFQLGTTMIESASVCDDDSLMKIVLNKCGYAEKNLSEEFVEHDFRVEQHVLVPLQNILEVDIPNINKQKRNVTKMCLDMDSAKTRYQQVQKHTPNNTAGAAKVESIKDELKDSEQRVEQSRDVLACEMFNLAAKESDLCYTILQYYKFQKHCHEYALGILNKLIPELENEICSSKVKPVYGEDLEKHLIVTKRKIAFPIELCVCALLELGVEEEGLFRLAGSASKVKRMKRSFDAGCMTLATALSYRDPHVIAGALKSYLRELPEPLLTHDLYDEWLNAAKAQTHPDNKLQALWMVVHKLPKANFDNLSYLIKFFHVLSKNHEVNKMSPHNIAIVIAPSLIWTKDENGGSGFGLNVNVSLYPSIIDLLVTYADWFFDKDMDFYITLEPIMNGEFEEKVVDKGIDNKGFDIKVADKMHKSAIEKVSGQNHAGGDVEANAEEIKRSQSVNSLSEEVHSYESPRPITRRKNKSVAPCPPIFKEEKKKEEVKIIKDSSQSGKLKDANLINDKPDKPPRPCGTMNSTLPRPAKSNRENKSIESNQDDVRIHYIKSSSNALNENVDKQSSHIVKEKIIKTMITTSTNTDIQGKESFLVDSLNNIRLRPVAAPRSINSGMGSVEKPTAEQGSKPVDYCKVNLISVKKEWLLGKDNDTETSVPKKPAVPERPLSLKSQTIKARSNINVNGRNNYENISVFSKDDQNEKKSDDRILQKTQMFSIDKQQVAVIDVNDQPKSKLEESINDFTESVKKDEEELSEKNENKNKKGDDSDTNCKVVPVEEKKTSSSTLPFSGQMDKPERPPKPDYKFPPSSSHTRTLSDGQIIDIKSGDNTSDSIMNNNKSDSSHCIKFVINNNVTSETSTISSSSPPMSYAPIKHPQSSPPPPPAAKPRANSQSESTDF